MEGSWEFSNFAPRGLPGQAVAQKFKKITKYMKYKQFSKGVSSRGLTPFGVVNVTLNLLRRL